MRSFEGRFGLPLAALALLALTACSDDDDKPKPDSRPPDMAAADAADDAKTDSAQDTGPGDVGLDVDAESGPDGDGPPPLPPKYSATFQALEFVGKNSAGQPQNLVLYLPSFPNTNDPSVKPDWVFPAMPPNCQGWKWKQGEFPNVASGDAGKVTFSGHNQVQWFDPADPNTSGTLPANIECTLKELGTTGRFDYDCGLPTPFATTASVIPSSGIGLDWAGGADIPAKSFSSLSVFETAVQPKASFDLNKVDPSKGITAEWESTKATIVGVGFLARLEDGSEMARIFCATLAVLGKKTIAQEGLDLFPTPTAQNPLHITTLLFAANLNSSTETWGDWTILVSNGGLWGQSCVTPSGFCPPPATPDAGPGPDAGPADSGSAD